MGRTLVQSLAGATLIVMCVAAGWLLANAVDLVHPGLLVRGRDFRATAAVVALLVGVAGLWWQRASARPLTAMLSALAIVELVIAILIITFSGTPAVDWFFLDWFLGVNVYIGVPWLCATALAFLWPRRTAKR